MMFVSHPSHARAAVATATLLVAAVASGQTSQDLQIRALAATCANCHGTDGKAVDGQAMPQLAGLAKDYLVAQMLAFRDGRRPATVMHQLSKGYSNEQIEAISAYLATRK